MRIPRLARPSLLTPARVAFGVAGTLLASSLVGPTTPRAAAGTTPELQKRINEAGDKGADWRRAQRNGDGSFQPLMRDGQAYWQIGMAALCGLALLAAGDSRDDPGIKQITEYLQKRDTDEARGGSRTTYGTGILLMFLTEVHRPKPKAGPYAKAAKKDPCNLSKDTMA